MTLPQNPHHARRWLILGIILGSFFLVVSCVYWADLHVPKIDRAKFKFNNGDRQ